MNILVTGSAGFIRFFFSFDFLKRGEYVIRIYNHYDYHDPRIKVARKKNFLNF